jgi:hypothetical protein
MKKPYECMKKENLTHKPLLQSCEGSCRVHNILELFFNSSFCLRVDFLHG